MTTDTVINPLSTGDVLTLLSLNLLLSSSSRELRLVVDEDDLMWMKN